jgi:hypothetical protein
MPDVCLLSNVLNWAVGSIGEVGDVLHDNVEIAALHGRIPKLGLDGQVLRLDADAPPLVDGVRCRPE